MTSTSGRAVPGRDRGARFWVIGLAVMLTLSGCEGTLDELIGVDRPGQLPADELNNPALLDPLVGGVQSSFECAFAVYINYFGLWSGVLNHGNARDFQVEQRNVSNVTLYDRSCEGGSYANPGFGALHMARAQAVTAIELLDGFTEAEVPNRQALLGKSRLYEAYSTLLLGEAFCAYTEDNGPVQTRAQAFRLAEERFTRAIEHASQVASVEDASLIRNAALIGRARARLNLWSLNEVDAGAVVEDASQVADGFVFYSRHEDGAGPRRTNQMYTTNIDGKGWIAPKYRQLRLLEGVPDPRLPLYETNIIPTGTNVLGWAARKFRSEGDDMPIGTWREAMLMIAEVEGGQTAVDIINHLRATVADAPYVEAGTYNLATFSSTDPVAILAEVRKERMRETFLMGVHMGDLMRWLGNSVAAPFDVFPTGIPERGIGQYSDPFTCRPFPDYEVLGNSNITEPIPFPTTPL